jgi:ABC-type transport system involved in cytochrome bd biosynthesis fused ATPase/permease subunit
VVHINQINHQLCSKWILTNDPGWPATNLPFFHCKTDQLRLVFVVTFGVASIFHIIIIIIIILIILIIIIGGAALSTSNIFRRSIRTCNGMSKKFHDPAPTLD